MMSPDFFGAQLRGLRRSFLCSTKNCASFSYTPSEQTPVPIEADRKDEMTRCFEAF